MSDPHPRCPREHGFLRRLFGCDRCEVEHQIDAEDAMERLYLRSIGHPLAESWPLPDLPPDRRARP